MNGRPPPLQNNMTSMIIFLVISFVLLFMFSIIFGRSSGFFDLIIFLFIVFIIIFFIVFMTQKPPMPFPMPPIPNYQYPYAVPQQDKNQQWQQNYQYPQYQPYPYSQYYYPYYYPYQFNYKPLPPLALIGGVFAFIVGMALLFFGAIVYTQQAYHSRYFNTIMVQFSGMFFALSGVLLLIGVIFASQRRFKYSANISIFSLIILTIAGVIYYSFYVNTIQDGSSDNSFCMTNIMIIGIFMFFVILGFLKSIDDEKQDEIKVREMQKVNDEMQRKEFLRSLDERLVKGEISEQTYKDIRKRQGF